MHSTGWYLGLRYMQGAGLVARAAEPIDAQYCGANFIFADRILCSAKNWQELINDWWDAIAINGCLILWLPDCRHFDLEPGEAKLTLEDVMPALHHRIGWQLCEADLIDGHIYIVWRKHADALKIISPWRKRPKHALIARTGAHGDALMASSILPGLKDKGYAISFISREAGCEILKSDPHIDEPILLAAGQVKEEELPYYWQAWAKRFDRFINLTCSVEGDLLKQPPRGDYWWPDDQRRKQCNRSYLRYLHKLARVPEPYRVKFYPSAEEKIWAQNKTKELKAQNGGFILWCLRGSAVHKWWPYAPEAICRLLAKTNVNIVLTGDAAAEPLAQEVYKAVEKYHGDTNRLHKLVNTNTIREIMALAHYANVVVGPETGVLNAVSLQPAPKVLLLSHSSAANLSDDWVMATALTPSSPCYPCHRLHYSHDWCPQDEETGAAVCAASIGAKQVVDAVYTMLQNKIIPPWWLHQDKRKRSAMSGAGK